MGDTEEEAPLLGRVLAGKLRLDARIAAGAMGEVYRARHLALDKDVAVKTIRPDRGPNPEISERFIREARTASRLNHPNSVVVLDFGQDSDGLLYLAMELLDGQTLLEALYERGRLPLREACFFMGQVLAGLAAAHDKGVLHRDIKPSNMMLVPTQDDDGHPSVQVKVLDFGLAKFADSADTLAGGGERRLIGTPLYMSPEQAVSETLDERSDLYACGVVFFEMLVGRPPFEAERAVSVLMKHCAAPIPRASDLVAGLPKEVDEVLFRALDKDRDHRFQSARAFRSAVLELMHLEMPVAEHPPPPSRDTSYFLKPSSTGPYDRVPRSNIVRTPLPPTVEASLMVGDDLELPIENAIEDPTHTPVPSIALAEASQPGSLESEVPDTLDLLPEPTTDSETLLPPMRIYQPDIQGRPTADARFLWERYQLSPHRRPPHRGFWLLDAERNQVGPLTFDELCVALRLEALDGALDRSLVSADPRPELWCPAPELLRILASTGVGQTIAPAAVADGGGAGWIDPTSVPGLLVRASLAEMTGRLIFASTTAAKTTFFEVHLVSGRPTQVDTNELSLQLPSILVARGALSEDDLPLLVVDAIKHRNNLELSARRLAGAELDEQRGAVMRRRLRHLLKMTEGTWVLDPAYRPVDRRAFAPSLQSILPRLVRDALSRAALEAALRPHLGRPLAALEGIEDYVDTLGFTSGERTIAEELLAAARLEDALPLQEELRKAYLTVAFLLISSARRPI